MRSITHEGYYHELHELSNTIIVLVFSVMTSFVRMILQREENKGVELTMCPCNSMWAALLAGEDFFEERGNASGGVGADLLFFLTEHEKQAVQGFANDVLVDIEGRAFCEGDGSKLTDEGIPLLRDGKLIHGPFHDRTECDGQLASGLRFEVIGGCGISAV